MTHERYTIEINGDHAVCTDNYNALRCTFTLHKFNDEQRFDFPELPGVSLPSASELARLAREMGDYLNNNHANLLF